MYLLYGAIASIVVHWITLAKLQQIERKMVGRDGARRKKMHLSPSTLGESCEVLVTLFSDYFSRAGVAARLWVLTSRITLVAGFALFVSWLFILL